MPLGIAQWRIQIFLETGPPPYLSLVWITPPPPSYLKVWIRHRCPHAVRVTQNGKSRDNKTGRRR